MNLKKLHNYSKKPWYLPGHQKNEHHSVRPRASLVSLVDPVLKFLREKLDPDHDPQDQRAGQN